MITLLLFAASHIYSPNFGAFVKTGPGITLDTSVSSADTPGSCDFNPAAHPYLKRPEATAFYSLFDNYYAHQVYVSFPSLGHPKASYLVNEDYYLMKDHDFVTVATNALFNYPALMSCADRIINASGGYYSGPFDEDDSHTSSSAFDLLGMPTWSNHWFQATTSLDDWSSLAIMGQLQNSSIFHFSTPYNKYYHHLQTMMEDVCFHEYMAESNTLADVLLAYEENLPSLPTFESVVDAAFPTNDISQITNRSLAISWKPLCAISQTLALMDSYVDYCWQGSGYFDAVRHSSYSQSAKDDDCGSASVKIKDDGSLEAVSTPAPDPSVEVSGVETNVTVASCFDYDWAARVTGVSHDGGVTCYTNIQSESCITVDVAYACHIIDEGTNTEFILWLSFDDVSVSFPNWSGEVVGRIDDRSAILSWEYVNIGDIAGSYDVPIKGVVSTGYRHSEDDVGSWHPNTDNNPLGKSCVEKVSEYWVSSYACTTNAAITSGEPYYDIWPCERIDLGYYPPAAKPTPRDTSMRWGYRKQTLGVWNPNQTSYSNASRSFHYNHLVNARQWIIEELIGILGGDYRYPEDYMGLTAAAANRILKSFYFKDAQIHYSGEEGYTYEIGFPITRSGATYSPSEVYFHPSAGISLRYVSDDPHVFVHPSAGADTARAGRAKYKMAYPSLRLNID